MYIYNSCSNTLILLPNIYRSHCFLHPQILADLIGELPRLESNHEDIKLRTAELLADVVECEVISFTDVYKVLVNGNIHPLALEFMKLLKESKGVEWLKSEVETQPVPCRKLLPGGCEASRSF